jgi:hypothetical protein
MILKNLFSVALVALFFGAFSPSDCRADLVFSHDFDNGTAGAVTALGDLGTPSVGAFAVEGGVAPSYGFISGDGAFTSGNDANTRVTIPAAGAPPLGTAFEASAGTSFNGLAPANRLFANFAAADITGGNGAIVNFDVGSYGTQNLGAFKALNVRGLSSTGDEVFESWISFGSGNGSRRIYAREAGDTTYTRTSNTAGSPEGTLLYNNIPGAWNSTNNADAPGGLATLTISIVDGMVTYDSSVGNAGATLTFAQNSGATDLAQIEFTSVNFNQGGNSGYWLDNVAVNTTAVPEPGSTIVFGTLALGLISRRRRSAS